MGIARTALMIQMMTMITLVVDLLICGLSGNMIAWYLEFDFLLNKVRIFHCKPVNCDSRQREDTGVNTEVLQIWVIDTFVDVYFRQSNKRKELRENFKILNQIN